MPASSSACRNRRCRGRCRRSNSELGVSLFHRHARGLILTEQGELLYRTAHEVFMKLEAARAKLTDSRERPNGELRVTTTPGIGVHWLTPRLGEFLDLYPDIRVTLITTEEELDLAMREADVAIRLRQPIAARPDPAQAVLAAFPCLRVAGISQALRHAALGRRARQASHRDPRRHRVPPWLQQTGNWLLEVGRDGGEPRIPWLTINNVLGVLRACQRGIGIAMLPDYLVEENGGLVQLFGDSQRARLRRLFRLSGRTEVGRARAGVPRFPGRQSAALAFLAAATCRIMNSINLAARSARMAGMRPTVLFNSCASRHTAMFAVGDRLPILPDRNRNAGSCSPLEGEGRPRADKLKPGPQGSGFFSALSLVPILYWMLFFSTSAVASAQ